ncbi:hypothetical protein LZ30DRAFT_389673 [Colletotrichum cereale]|nr:hypothetical protein LZ30DRAFT_389673 [Colletotrichum cereale]
MELLAATKPGPVITVLGSYRLRPCGWERPLRRPRLHLSISYAITGLNLDRASSHGLTSGEVSILLHVPPSVSSSRPAPESIASSCPASRVGGILFLACLTPTNRKQNLRCCSTRLHGPKSSRLAPNRQPVVGTRGGRCSLPPSLNERPATR